MSVGVRTEKYVNCFQFIIQPQVKKEFQGNLNGFVVQKHVLTYGVGTTLVRFSYFGGFYQQCPCLRVEIYGTRVIEPKGKC